VQCLLRCLDPGELRRGAGRAERPGGLPRGVRGRAPAPVAGQRGSRRLQVAHGALTSTMPDAGSPWSSNW